ncbi:unnamed protein product [Prunus armeniaca]|uniref:Uncharacterized protein n=1 Tax=Prunus armeniaca TaxID=36596 RepID=A0A6J5Y713_PRUAR|nr:unnamed protein product [Prunus armeniaca]
MGKTLMCGTRDHTTLHNMMNPPARNTSKIKEKRSEQKQAIIFIYKRTPRNWRSLRKARSGRSRCGRSHATNPTPSPSKRVRRSLSASESGGTEEVDKDVKWLVGRF